MREISCFSLVDNSSSQHSPWFMLVFNYHQLAGNYILTLCCWFLGDWEEKILDCDRCDWGQGLARYMTLSSLVNTRHSNMCWMNEWTKGWLQPKTVLTLCPHKHKYDCNWNWTLIKFLPRWECRTFSQGISYLKNIIKSWIPFIYSDFSFSLTAQWRYWSWNCETLCTFTSELWNAISTSLSQKQDIININVWKDLQYGSGMI